MNQTLNLTKQLIGLDGLPAVMQSTAGEIPVTVKTVLLDALNQKTRDLDTIEKVYERGKLVNTIRINEQLSLTPQLVVLFENVLFETNQTPTATFQIIEEMGSRS